VRGETSKQARSVPIRNWDIRTCIDDNYPRIHVLQEVAAVFQVLHGTEDSGLVDKFP